MDQLTTWEAFSETVRKHGYTIYESSKAEADGVLYAMVRSDTEKKLAVGGEAAGFSGASADGITYCDLSVENAKALMDVFPFTRPVSHKGRRLTVGLGDRLGVATPGLIRAVAGYDAFPVLAQQSIRELTLTGRTFPGVIADACFGVFQEGYRGGYGADGDHLKTREEIRYAIESGCSMITLDCSAHIRDKVDVESTYLTLPQARRAYYEQNYLDQKLPFVGRLTLDEVKRIAVVFDGAITHAIDCYGYIRSLTDREVDFELSIDEAMSITLPAEHYVIANELKKQGITPVSVAPHFTGEFEKGIDYQGDLAQYVQDLQIHQKIAEFFGYKLSLHSGSDKLSVYPMTGKITGCDLHVKTAGTNWLEALRILARKDPALYRRAHKFALEHWAEATRYYHVTTDPKTIANIDYLSDACLPDLLNKDASRQLMHITYGLLLAEPWFRTPLYQLLHTEEEAFYAGLVSHIGRHMRYLTQPVFTE